MTRTGTHLVNLAASVKRAVMWCGVVDPMPHRMTTDPKQVTCNACKRKERKSR